MPGTPSVLPSHRVTGALVRAAGVVLTGLATAGCFVVVDPGETVETPSVSGALRAQGAALPDVELWVAPVGVRGRCESLAISTRTADDGTFSFEETRSRRTFEMVPLAPSTPAYTVQVCMDRGAGPEPLYLRTFAGWMPLHVSLDCDPNRASQERQACDAVLAGRQTPGFQGID